jgi:AcrR family transcriptional regulator
MTTDLRQNIPLNGDPDAIPEIASRILDAAVHLFARKGYAGTSVREIVQEAQVTNPMLYYYFDSKEGLFCFLTSLLHDEFARQLREAIEQGSDLEDKLIRIVDVHLRGLRDRPTVLRFVYSMLFGAQGSAPDHELYQSHQEIVEALVDLFEDEMAAGNFVPSHEFDLRWSTFQLLGMVNSHSMRIVKELELLPESDRSPYLEDNAGPETAEKIVRFFLEGAGDVKG